MFKAAYLKLTAWYVAIIMALSLAFSVWVYNEATREIRFGLERLRQPAIIGRQLPPLLAQALEEQLETSRQRILLNLIYLNMFVFGVGAAGSYLLAKRTMRPIEDAMQAQRRFTADASHELRTPLAVMKTEIEVALRDKKRSQVDLDELLKSNIEEIDRLAALSESLLQLAHDKPAVREPLALDKTIQRLVKRYTPLAARENILLKSTMLPLKVKGNKQDLEKILSILLDNAIKYSPPHTTIHLQVTRGKTMAEITVSDEGVGISPKDLPHIFERFYRADASRNNEVVAGYGLGLSIAKKLVLSLGGSLEARSRVGKGSTFTVTVPFA